jgi:HTH-type transcriptional regulator / antitoxin HipB
VTARTHPGDIDGCYDPIGVDVALLHPALRDLSPGRAAQKAEFGDRGVRAMIKNERQYTITRTKADEVRVAISELERAPLPEGLSPDMRDLQFDALRGTLGDLEAELSDYDALDDATLIEATGIGEFPTALIRARIARGLTQRELAERVGLAEQAIQRYEAGGYATVSFARLVEIADALGVTMHYDVRLASAS